MPTLPRQLLPRDSSKRLHWALIVFSVYDLTYHLQVRTSDKNITISNLPPLASVVKYEMPKSAYEEVPETVLAYKKAHKIGRFDPNGPQIQDRKVKEMWEEVDKRSTSPTFTRPSDSFS